MSLAEDCLKCGVPRFVHIWREDEDDPRNADPGPPWVGYLICPEGEAKRKAESLWGSLSTQKEGDSELPESPL